MKKIIFTLLALIGTMSMNAQVIQVMKIYKDNVLVAKYKASEANNVVFEEVPTKGKATATIGGVNTDVNWVQLWDDGPKFAEYNVGATSATEYGGYYCWGKTIDKDEDDKFKDGESVLTGNDDTATALWGSKWRMPTSAELSNAEGGLLYECNCTWTTQNGVNGLLCTGKGDYESNSVFLPAAGKAKHGFGVNQGNNGNYWSSMPSGSNDACYLSFDSNQQSVSDVLRYNALSVRAVLVEE